MSNPFYINDTPAEVKNAKVSASDGLPAGRRLMKNLGYTLTHTEHAQWPENPDPARGIGCCLWNSVDNYLDVRLHSP